MNRVLHEVWCSTGRGFVRGPRFRHLSDAELYVAEHGSEGVFAIRTPEGRWIKVGGARRERFAQPFPRAVPLSRS